MQMGADSDLLIRKYIEVSSSYLELGQYSVAYGDYANLSVFQQEIIWIMIVPFEG